MRYFLYRINQSCNQAGVIHKGDVILTARHKGASRRHQLRQRITGTL